MGQPLQDLDHGADLLAHCLLAVLEAQQGRAGLPIALLGLASSSLGGSCGERIRDASTCSRPFTVVTHGVSSSASNSSSVTGHVGGTDNGSWPSIRSGMARSARR